MDVSSLGYRTDLALLGLGGSRIEDRGVHIVVRSPHNPTFWWGNFLLLREVPRRADVDLWLERFAREFPDVEHIALGFDGVRGRMDDLTGFAERGLRPEAAAVMTASEVHEPPGPNRDATYRLLSSDGDWAQSIELRVRCNDEGLDPSAYRTFVTAKTATNRKLVEAGHGGWFGAFVEERLVAQMGLLRASPGLARFQSVETDPDHRRRGLAGTLVHHVSRYGFDTLSAETLVMVADPEYPAIRVYRSVGFSETETQLQVERPPVTDPPRATAAER